MKYFEEDFLVFFQELAANNTKEWFDDNRKRYESKVKIPFENFVADFILAVRPSFVQLNISAKQSIFRINKDIRFSNDKSPYKLNKSAAIAPGGRKDWETPGVYLELGPENVKIYGGIYQPTKEQLYNIRTYIAQHRDVFHKVLQQSSFTESFDTLHGEKNKILPADLKEAAALEPLIFNKSFYYFHTMEPTIILADDFLEIMLKHYENGLPMKDFLTKAIQGLSDL